MDDIDYACCDAALYEYVQWNVVCAASGGPGWWTIHRCTRCCREVRLAGKNRPLDAVKRGTHSVPISIPDDTDARNHAE